MPLQWLPLQQRQQQQPQRSTVSQALRPQRKGISGEGVAARWEREEAAEAERKYNEKMMKLQHEQGMEKLRFTTGLKEDAQKQQTTMGNVVSQAQQQGAARQKIESNPEPAAKEMYELLKTMPDETRDVLLQQIFTPSDPAGKMTSAGKTVTMPQKYNAIADIFINKGWATIGKEGKPVLSEPEREFEKGTFSITTEGGNVYQLNTATGERKKLGAVDEPEKTVSEINKDINEQALAIVKASKGTDNPITLPEAKFDVAKDNYNMDDDTAAEIAKIQEMPEDPTKLDFGAKIVNWFKNIGKAEVPSGYQRKGAGAEPTFNETNVTALIDIVSDDVTTAERAHLKGQGATDADIDEAIRRKAK